MAVRSSEVTLPHMVSTLLEAKMTPLIRKLLVATARINAVYCYCPQTLVNGVVLWGQASHALIISTKRIAGLSHERTTFMAQGERPIHLQCDTRVMAQCIHCLLFDVIRRATNGFLSKHTERNHIDVTNSSNF